MAVVFAGKVRRVVVFTVDLRSAKFVEGDGESRWQVCCCSENSGNHHPKRSPRRRIGDGAGGRGSFWCVNDRKT
ncbi:unnamed protein product [Linum trigynum]|uniref:Uncharacterized protein n=1 Tax=Linum trigynum TaxID=586398 RepID=A0AAV2CKE9_9ROSI